MNPLVRVEVDQANVSYLSTNSEFSEKIKNLSDGIHPVYYNKKVFKVLNNEQQTVDASAISFLDKIPIEKLQRLITEERIAGLCVRGGTIVGCLASSKWFRIKVDAQIGEMGIKIGRSKYLLIDNDTLLDESQKYDCLIQMAKRQCVSQAETKAITQEASSQVLPPKQVHQVVERKVIGDAIVTVTTTLEIDRPQLPPEATRQRASNTSQNTSAANAQPDIKSNKFYDPRIGGICTILDSAKGQLKVPKSLEEIIAGKSVKEVLNICASKILEKQKAALSDFIEGKRNLDILLIPDDEWPALWGTFAQSISKLIDQESKPKATAPDNYTYISKQKPQGTTSDKPDNQQKQQAKPETSSQKPDNCVLF